MTTAGIDIGHQSVNVVILEEDRVVDHATLVISGEVGAAARLAFDRSLEQAGMKDSDIDSVFTTGVGREKVTFSNGNRTEMLSHVIGAHRMFPSARTVIDVGAEGSRILRCDAKGNLTNFVLNDKCASGAGVFLETVAGMLGTPLSEIGALSLHSSKKVVFTTTCAVFAESEIVAEIHRGSSREDILWGVNESIASKVIASSKRVGVEADVVLTGGVARNLGVVEALKGQLGLNVLVSEIPEVAGALGAAILARRASGGT
jgi:predicted CoA-substrate-specific enzyme activase